MPDPTETRTRRHLWLTLLSVLALVAAVVVTLVAGRGQFNGSNTARLIDGELRLHTLDSAHLVCPSDPAFSPDGSRLMVFGILTTSVPAGASCSLLAQGAVPAAYAVAIFDTASGQLIRVMALDAHGAVGLARMSSPASTSGESSAPTLSAVQFAYSGLGWSPDGVHAAFAFTAFGAGQRTPDNVLDSGLLLLDTMSGRASIVRGDSGFFATVSGVSSGFPVWHLAQESELPSFVPQPGLAYSWNASGTPYPLAPLTDTTTTLPADAGPRYPVGSPAGGSRFTIWQPGLLIGSDGTDAGALQTAFVTAFPAWSPDGAQVTLMVAGVTLSAGPPAPAMRRPSQGPSLIPPLPLPMTLPLVPPRDPALSAIQQQVSDHSWAEVAWNGTGSLLASVDCFATSAQSLEVRDTATGTVLANQSLQLAPGDVGCATQSNADATGGYPSLALRLLWSPAGDRVLVSNSAASTLTLYHIHRRPASTGS